MFSWFNIGILMYRQAYIDYMRGRVSACNEGMGAIKEAF